MLLSTGHSCYDPCLHRSGMALSSSNMLARPTILKIVRLLAVLLFAAPPASEAQQTGSVYRIAFLGSGSP